MKIKPRILYYDILNIFACICVIAMHCNGIVHEYSNTAVWKQALIVEVIAYWAVPVFFMLSGAKLFTYRRKMDTKSFLKRRITKIAVPWLTWCMLWLIYRIVIIKSIQITSIRGGLSILYNGIINNELQAVYWFFIPMIMMYFCMPVLSCLADNRKVLWYIVGITFVTYSLIPELCAIVGIRYNGTLYFPMGGGYVLYVVLGYLLSTMDESPRIRHLVYFLGIASVVLRYGGTYYLSIKNNMKDTTYWGYLYFTCVFLSVAVFLFFKNRKYDKIAENKRSVTVIQYLSGCSFGIYLVHFMIIETAYNIFDVDRALLWWRTGGIIFVYVLSLVCVSVLKKIPGISRMLVP